MDSRFRGNDGGEAGIRRRKSDGGGGDSDLHRNGKAAEFREKNAVIPAKAGIYSGRLILEFREFYAKIKFGISAYFFCEKRGECGSLSVKMDSRFRGNDGGNPHILREKLISEFPQNDREKYIPFSAFMTRPRHLSGAKLVRRSLLRPAISAFPPLSIVCGKCRVLQQ